MCFIEVNGNCCLFAGCYVYNGNLTLLANAPLSAGVVDAQRLAGSGVIAMSAGTTIDTGTGSLAMQLSGDKSKTNHDAGSITLNNLDPSSILVENLGGGDVVLDGSLTASGTGSSIVIATLADFINNTGANALDPGPGRFVVYSQSPFTDTLGGLSGLPYYNTPYDPAHPGVLMATGNRFAYVLAPVLSVGGSLSRAYGDTVVTSTITGLINGDTLAQAVSGSPSVTSGADVSSSVGTYSVTLGQGNLHSDLNYGFSFGGASLTIDPAPLTITVNNANRTYGDANPDFSATITGLKLSDTASVVSGLAFNTPATASSDVGTYAISSAGGTVPGNYTIATRVDGSLTVNPALLTIAVNNASRFYGDANPSFSASVTGLKLSDTASIVSGLDFSTAATSSSNVGSYAVSVLGGALSSSNYTIASRVDGTLAVNPAPLTVTVDNASRLYGDANPSFSATVTGLKLSDTASIVSGLNYSTAATPPSNVGNYAVGVLGGTLASSNYTIASRLDGTLTVNPAPLTVTVDNASRLYGDANPTFTASVSGLKLSDSSSLLSGLSFTTGATQASGVGNYAVSSAGGTLSSSNYKIAARADGMLVIDPAPLAVTANDASRLYDTANPAFNFGVTGLKLNDGPGVISGLSLATTANLLSPPGSYPITASGGSAIDYIIASYAAGRLTIDPPVVTPPVTAAIYDKWPSLPFRMATDEAAFVPCFCPRHVHGQHPRDCFRWLDRCVDPCDCLWTVVPRDFTDRKNDEHPLPDAFCDDNALLFTRQRLADDLIGANF